MFSLVLRLRRLNRNVLTVLRLLRSNFNGLFIDICDLIEVKK